MKGSSVLVGLVLCAVAAAELATEEDESSSEELGRGHHRRRRKRPQGPCGAAGYGRTFGFHDQTYISAPVMNYYFGCGVVPVAPIAPIAAAPHIQPAPYPIQIGVSQAQNQQFGHHGHHGHHGGGHFGGFNPGLNSGYAPGFNQNYNQGFNQNFRPGYNQVPFQNDAGVQRPNGPLQSVVSAAAAGLGGALADYIARPRKTQKQFNRQVNQLFRPLNKLF